MATVIRAGEVGSILRRLSTVDLADHLSEARDVVEAAKRRAASSVTDAEREVVQLHEQARVHGHAEGRRAGYEEGAAAGRREAYEKAIEEFRAEHADVVADLQHSVRGIDEIKERLGVTAQAHLLDFALQIATKLTFAIGKVHRDAATQNFTRALELVGSRTNLRVRVHPDDVRSMETFAVAALETINASQAVEIVPDDALSPGGCVVETARTTVDATLETQIDEIVALLLGEPSRDA